MTWRALSIYLRWSAMLAAGAMLVVGEARAGGCSRRPLIQTRPLTDGFALRPEGLLERHPQGGEALESAVSEILAVDPRAHLGRMLGLLRGRVTPLQKRALGTGAGRAAVQCRLMGEGESARWIADAVRRLDDREVQTAFLHAFGPPEPGIRAVPATPEAGPRSLVAPLGSARDPFEAPRLGDPLAPVR